MINIADKGLDLLERPAHSPDCHQLPAAQHHWTAAFYDALLGLRWRFSRRLQHHWEIQYCASDPAADFDYAELDHMDPVLSLR